MAVTPLVNTFVALETVPFLTSSMAPRVGVPDAVGAVVLLLVIGSLVTEAQPVLDALRAFQASLTPAGKRPLVEILIAVAGTRESRADVIRGFMDQSSALLMIGPNSSERRQILTDLQIDPDWEGSLAPQLMVLDWLGAQRFYRGDVLPVSGVCHIAQDVFGQIRRHPHPVSLVESWKEQCNFFYPEIRDIIFQLRKYGERTLEKLVDNLRVVQAQVCHPMVPLDELADTPLSVSFQAYNEAYIQLEEFALNDRLVKLLGLTRLSSRSPNSLQRLGLSATFHCDYMQSFLTRTLRQLTAKSHPAMLGKLPAHHPPAFAIKLLYRSREWDMIREIFPPDLAQLKALIHHKIPDVNLQIARMFSPQFGGFFEYTTAEEFATALAESRDPRTGYFRIRILLMDMHNRQNQVGPAPSRQAVFAAIAEMEAEVVGQPPPGLLEFTQKDLLSAAIAAKLIEVDEYQKEALRRMPVFEIHTAAARAVLMHREQRQTRSRLAATLSELSYQEALLKELIQWFSDEHFGWLSESADCPTCGHHIAYPIVGDEVLVGTSDETNLFDAHLVEKWICRPCRCDAVVNHRPLNDVLGMFVKGRGRCGEHAKAFALAARAIGLDARIVVAALTYRNSTANLGFFNDNSMNHFWNEIYLDQERGWVHVDVSAGPDSNMGLSVEDRFDSPAAYDRPGSIGRIQIVGGASNDGVVLLTRKYLTSIEALQFADRKRPEAYLLRETELFSEIFMAHPVSTPLSLDYEARRKAHVHHVAQTERAWLHRLFQQEDNGADVGRSASFFTRYVGTVEVDGGEIPDWRIRRADQHFSSYGSLMEIKSPSWRVSKVEVCTVDGLVNRVRFSYEEAAPRGGSLVRTRPASLGSDVGDIWAPMTGCRVTPVLAGDFVANLRVAQNVRNQVTHVHVELYSTLVSGGTSPEGGNTPYGTPDIQGSFLLDAPQTLPVRAIVGVYGSRDNSLAIDFLATYSISIQTSHVQTGSPPVAHFARRASAQDSSFF